MKKHTSPRANGAQTTPHTRTHERAVRTQRKHDLKTRLRGHWYVSRRVCRVEIHDVS